MSYIECRVSINSISQISDIYTVFALTQTATRHPIAHSKRHRQSSPFTQKNTLYNDRWSLSHLLCIIRIYTASSTEWHISPRANQQSANRACQNYKVKFRVRNTELAVSLFSGSLYCREAWERERESEAFISSYGNCCRWATAAICDESSLTFCASLSLVFFLCIYYYGGARFHPIRRNLFRWWSCNDLCCVIIDFFFHWCFVWKYYYFCEYIYFINTQA